MKTKYNKIIPRHQVGAVIGYGLKSTPTIYKMISSALSGLGSGAALAFPAGLAGASFLDYVFHPERTLHRYIEDPSQTIREGLQAIPSDNTIVYRRPIPVMLDQETSQTPEEKTTEKEANSEQSELEKLQSKLKQLEEENTQLKNQQSNNENKGNEKNKKSNKDNRFLKDTPGNIKTWIKNNPKKLGVIGVTAEILNNFPVTQFMWRKGRDAWNNVINLPNTLTNSPSEDKTEKDKNKYGEDSRPTYTTVPMRDITGPYYNNLSK